MIYLYNKYLKINIGDAREINIDNNKVDLVVTSPPYVTSYEYADIHQLTIFWLNYAKDLEEFRKKFIGTSYHAHKKINLNCLFIGSINSFLTLIKTIFCG